MKKFEQVKRLYHTMCDEYNHYSNDKIFVSAITSDFDRLFELCWKSLKEYRSSAPWVDKNLPIVY